MTHQQGDETVAPHAPLGLHGRIRVPPSKSLTQRALVAAAMAGGGSRVVTPLDAEDPRLLVAALEALGYRLDWRGDEVVAGGRDEVGSASLFLGNNGTGVRFVLAQAAALPGRWRIDGVPRLRQRPIAALAAALTALGAAIEPADAGGGGGELRLPLDVAGRALEGGRVALDAAASSQFVSALLLLGARLPRGLQIHLAAPPPSRPYIDLTLEVLRAFGVECGASSLIKYAVGGGLRPAELTVEGDWSAAAFPLAAVAVAGGEVEVEGVRLGSAQGDAAVAALLAEAGAEICESPDGVVVRGPAARPLRADLRDTPDLFPALAVVTAVVGGRLEGLAGLAAKESDRVAVMVSHLRAMGFAVDADGQAFHAIGGLAGTAAPPAALDPAGDHRIAMALAVAGTVFPGVQIGDPGCTTKSWPAFWPQWRELVGAPS